MKKHVFFIASIIMLSCTIAIAQQEVIIGFSFADNTNTEFTAD